MLKVTVNADRELRGLQKMPSILRKMIGRESQSKAQQVVALLQDYPPETDANNPPSPYWQRGVGRVWGSGHISPNSQKLGSRWSITHNPATTEIENPVTYAVHVHSTKKQAWFHKERGWLTIGAALEKVGISELSNLDSGDDAIVDEKTRWGQELAAKAKSLISNLFS